MDVVTFGETMVMLTPAETGPMTYSAEFRKRLGGAESNLAVALSRLGHEVGWVSRLGDDPHGRYVRAFVRGEGVDTSRVRFDPDAPTGLMFKERRELGESRVYYYRHGSAASRLSPDDLPADYVADAEYLHVTGITPALSSTCREAVFETVELARERGVAVSFDPNVRLKLWDDLDEMRETMRALAGRADVVFLGREEGDHVFGTDDPDALADATLGLGAGTVTVKLGAEGALVADGGVRERIEGHDVERVVDPVGAGDGFAAGYLAGLLRGLDPVESTRLANAVGAFATTVVGDVEGLPTDAELDAFLGEAELVTR